MAKRGSKMAKKAKTKGVSQAKMTNIQNMKRLKRREFTPKERLARKDARREKRKATYAKLVERKTKELQMKLRFETDEELYPLSAEVTGEEMVAMMAPDDLTYLMERNKDEQMEDDQMEKENAEKENTEQSYELKERSFNPFGNDVRALLPFKTKTGIIERYAPREDEPETKTVLEEKEFLNSTAEEKEETLKEDKQEDKPIQKSVIELMAEREEKLEEKKVAIGCLSVNFLERPLERMQCLGKLVSMLEEKDRSICYSVKKYAAVSLLEVFHKTIPQYHITPHDLTQKLKKETKEQFLFENFLLKSYQTYLKGLEEFLKVVENNKTNKNKPFEVKDIEKELAMVALKCMGELLNQHNRFTYTNNIISALVPFLNHKDDEMCHLVVPYFNTLFKDDIPGDLSLEAVKRIDHFIRKRSYRVRIECLKVFLSLRIKNVKSLDDELEAKNIAKKKLTHTEKLLRKLIEENKPKKSRKEARKFRKVRKLEEQRKEYKIQQEEEVRSVQHSQIIEILFGLYFHILKRRPNNRLNGIVLEGLAKFAHLVNVEFFSDLLNVLGGLMEEGTLKFRESLHCTQTVFTILSDQGEALTLDPRRFYTYLYANMFQLNAGHNQDDIKSALLSLMEMLVIRRKRVSAARVNAFTKRLVTLSLTLLHNGSVASLATARYIMLTHPTSEVLREIDVEGASGVFSAEIEEPENSNATSATLWEIHTLNRHYHNTVRQFARHLSIGVPLHGEGQLPPNLGHRRVEDLYDDFDPSEMRFNPSIAKPSQMYSKGRNSAKRQKTNQWRTQYMNHEVETLFENSDKCFDISSEPQHTLISKNKKNGLKRKQGSASEEDINYFCGLLPNMNLNKIKISALPEVEDSTHSLINVDFKT